MSKNRLISYGGCRIGLKKNNVVVLNFGTGMEYISHAEFAVSIDGKAVEADVNILENTRAKTVYKCENILFDRECQVMVPVPDSFRKIRVDVKFDRKYGNCIYKFAIKAKIIKDIQSGIMNSVDNLCIYDDKAEIMGWCVDSNPVSIELLSGGEIIPCEITRTQRADILEFFQRGELIERPGFCIIFDKKYYKKVTVRMMAGNKIVEKTFPVKPFSNTRKSFPQLVRAAYRYYRNNGLAAVMQKMKIRTGNRKTEDYSKWIKYREPLKKELELQRKITFETEPKISIVVPVYRPVPEYFVEMIKSVMAQTYANWELCLADGSGKGEYVDSYIANLLNKDSRIKYKRLSQNLGISENTNEALSIATGDFIALGDHDDLLRPNALYEFVKAINENPEIDFIYSDEDKFDTEAGRRVMPHFKPDFNLDLLRTNNYICHFTMFSRKLYEENGGFRSKYDGAQDYDLFLRYTDVAKCIKHVDKVLYSWRIHSLSTAGNTGAKDYVVEAGRMALEDYFKRKNISASVTNSSIPCIYKVEYELMGKPLISILIPNKDHIDDLDVCLKSIIDKQDYDNYEIIIIENNSTDSSTFEYYKKIEHKYDKISVVYYEDDFNYSKINNYGAEYAKGDYLLLLNNDTEMLNSNVLSSMLSFGQRSEVGIVGARLLYSDNTIQHAGVVIGLGGVAGHIFLNNSSSNPGYFARTMEVVDYSAVTAACLLIRKSVFEEIGGLEEDLKVAFNDVDMCLKVREKGYLVVYDPYAVLNHYESKSRGIDDTPEKAARFRGETEYMRNKWVSYYKNGDPYYNRNLSLIRVDCSLRGDYEQELFEQM